MDSYGEDFAGRSIIDGEHLSTTSQLGTPDFAGPGSSLPIQSLRNTQSLQTVSLQNQTPYSDLDDLCFTSLTHRSSRLPNPLDQTILKSSSYCSSYYDAKDNPDYGACSPASSQQTTYESEIGASGTMDDLIQPLSLSPNQNNQTHISPSPARVRHPVDDRPSSSVPGNRPKESHRQGATIEVTGYKNSETVKRYFSVQGKSGGGALEKDGFIEDSRIRRINITFKDPIVVQAVISRKHELEGQQLTVIRAQRKTPDRRFLLLSGLPKTDEESLFLFLETRTKIGDHRPTIQYKGNQSGTALVRYQTEIREFDNVVRSFRNKPFRGAIIAVHPVYAPECILAKGIPAGTHKDTIEYFFEDILEKQSGPGEEHVRDVQMMSQDQALVFFNDHKDVDRILRTDLPQLDETATLSVEEFHECMGTRLTEIDRSEIPTPISVDVQFSLTDYIMNSSCHKERFEEEMLAAHAQIRWSHNGNPRKMLVEPMSDSQSHQRAWENWETKVRKTLRDLFSQYQAKTKSITKECWDPVIHQLDSIRQSCDVNISLVKERKNTLLLSGMKTNVSEAMKSLNQFVQELTEESNLRTRNEDVTEVLSLQPHKIMQLEMCQITKKIRLKHPDVRVSILKEENKVEFSGKRADILAARVLMSESLGNLFQSTPKLNLHQCKFIIQVKDEICETFSKRNIRASCVENNTVKVSGETDGDTKRACEFLQDEIKYDQVTLTSKSEEAVLQDHTGSDFVRFLNAKNAFALSYFNPKDKCLEIAGFREAFNYARDACTQYVKDNAITEYFMSLPKGQVKYLQKHFGATEIQTSVSVKWNHELHPGISFRGRSEDVRKAKQKIRIQTQKIVEKSHPVSRIGIRALLDDQKFLTPIEEKHKCFIEIIDKETPKLDRGPELVGLPRRSTSIVKGQYRIHTRQVLFVCFGDLTTEVVDAVVNAANTRMQHDGGVAGAIVKAGGQTIQDESNKIMQSKTGELISSEVICTGSGKLACNYVLHVAGPIWQGGHHQEESILWDSVTNVLDKANEMGLKSIAMPAISSGIYNFPVKLCAQTIIQATCEYFATQQKATSVTTIRFINIEEETCKHFTDILNASPHLERQVHDEGGYAAQNIEAVAASISPFTAIRNSSDTISTIEGKTIKLKKGNVAKEKVDVIVNSVGVDVVLRGGAVSSAILNEAGSRLQQECDSKLRGGRLSPWKYIKTGPVNLQCQVVYHLNCSNYDFSGKSEQQQIEKNFVHSLQEIFEDADSMGKKSIAFPAIGTGNLGFPPKVVAHLMFEAALTFSNQTPTGSLNDIRFVLYHQNQNIITAFEDEMQNILRHQFQPTHFNHGQPTQKSPLKPKSKTSDTEKIYEDFQEGTSGVCSIIIGSINVELTEGDILTANTDVIVNSTNTDFSLTGPLSSAILKLGGRTIQDECKKLGRHHLHKEQVALTGAGQFKHTKKIAHIMIDRYNDTSADLKEKIQKALEVADKYKMTSIALPAVGTGNPNCRPKDVAKALFKAIGTFAVSNPQHLGLVQIYIFQPTFFHDYKSVMSSQEGHSYDLNLGKRVYKKILTKTAHVRGYDKQSSQRRIRKHSSKVEESEEAKEQMDTVVFHILAGNHHDISAAESTLEECIRAEFTTKEIPYDKNCGKLSTERRKRLESAASRNQTAIEFLIGESRKSSRFAIRGKKDNNDTTETEILKLLTEFQVEEKQQIENELLYKEVQWRYQDELGQFLPYDAEINALVESAYRKKDPFVDLELEDGKFRIDFHKMEEVSLTGKKQRVYRADLGQEAIDRLPEHWDPHLQRNSIAISNSSPEYKEVSDSFHHSLQGTSAIIIKIERIQNVELWKQYMAKKDTMVQMSPSHPIERDLFHGTSGNTVQNINSQGFNRSFHGVNGTVYGRGTYFAQNSKYSVDYTGPDGNGSRYMYRCKVLSGEYTKGDPSLIVPPDKPNSPGESFDSVVDNPQKPTIFVVFRDAQAYPEYLITFKCR